MIKNNAVRFPSDTERAETNDLLLGLQPTGSRGTLRTDKAAEQLGKFIGFRPIEVRRTEGGICLITQPMIDRLVARK